MAEPVRVRRLTDQEGSPVRHRLRRAAQQRPGHNQPDPEGPALGSVRPEGFAAMGVAETLLHTHDITQGLFVDCCHQHR